MEKTPLGDIISRSVITVTLATPVSELLATMEEHRTRCVVAIDSAHRPLGIFTEQDALRLMAERCPIETLCMADVMSAQPYTASADMDFRDAYPIISAQGYRHILVTQANGALIGIAREADFMRHMGISCVEREEPSYLAAIARHLSASQQIAAQLRIQNTALNSTANAIVITNIAGIIEWANPAFSEMTGYALHEVMGKQPKDLVRSGLQPGEFYEALWNTILSGQVWRGELVNKRKDGTHYTEEMTITPVPTEDKIITHFIAVKQDISQRKAAERKVVQSEVTYRGILNNLTEAVYVVDEQGRFLDINQGALAMYGYSREEMLNQQNAWTILATEKNNLAELQDKLQKLFAGEPQHMEFWGVRKNGEVFPKSVNGVRGEYFGRTVAIIVARDISAIKQAEQQLKAAERTYRGLLNSIDDAVCVRDEKGLFLDVNDAAVRLYSHSREEIIGQGIEFLIDFSINDRDAIGASLQLAATGQAQRIEFFGTRPNGDTFIAEASIAKSEFFGKPAFIAVAREITARKLAEEKLATREAYLTSIIENQPGLVWLKDIQGRYLMTNAAFTQLCRQTAAQLAGKTDFDLWPHDLAEKYRVDDDRVIQQGQSIVIQEYVIKNGLPQWFETFKSPVRNQQGEIIGSTGLAHDISARRAIEEQLREAAAVMENTHEGVVITDTTPKILAVNAAYSRITGYSADEVIGKNPNIVKSGRQSHAFNEALWQSLLTQGYWQGEIWNRRKDGSVYPQLLTISTIHDENHASLRYVGVFADISELKENEAKLEFIAHHDALTQLPNRSLVESRLEQELEQAHRHQQKLAVLFIDLDRFKAVNDSYGHLIGDELLCEVTARLNSRLREGDTLGRLGGDEFILIITNLSVPQDAAVVARDFIIALNEPFRMSNGNEVFIGGSIGISLFPQDGDTKSDLMRNADAAMYLAKENGRNQFSFYTRTLNAHAQSKLQMENDLRHAILQNQLLLHFQPQVSLRTGKICGAEALIRWQKNDGSLVPPDEFIPLAERSGLILTIGNWVIEQACLQLRLWLDEGLSEASVAVNVSARQFRSGNLPRLIEQALKKYKVPAQHLEVELTESMLMHDPDAAISILQQLKQLGIKLSMDDFGTGYSNFGYLSRFPIDVLKIDQSFVQNVVTDADAAEIASAIIGLAHRMKLGVIAEGMETAAQLAFLQANGCDEMQGYYFSKPLPAQEFAALLHSGKSLAVANNTTSAQRTLLIVEEDTDTLREIKDSLQSDDYRILTATLPAVALELMTLHSVQVVLITPHLPRVNAQEFLQQVQRLHPCCMRLLLADRHAQWSLLSDLVNSGMAHQLLIKPITDEHLRQHIRDSFAYYAACHPSV